MGHISVSTVKQSLYSMRHKGIHYRELFRKILNSWKPSAIKNPLLRYLSLSTKFPHQKIRWTCGIFCSGNNRYVFLWFCYIAKVLFVFTKSHSFICKGLIEFPSLSKYRCRTKYPHLLNLLVVLVLYLSPHVIGNNKYIAEKVRSRADHHYYKESTFT